MKKTFYKIEFNLKDTKKIIEEKHYMIVQDFLKEILKHLQ